MTGGGPPPGLGDFSAEPEGGIEALMRGLTYTPADESELTPVAPDVTAATGWARDYAVKIVMLPDGFPELHLFCAQCREVLERGPAPIPLNRQVMAGYRHEIDKHGAGPALKRPR